MEIFVVSSKDLFNPQKNPGLKLSVKAIEENNQIPKTRITEVKDNNCPFCGKVCKTPAGLSKHLNGRHK